MRRNFLVIINLKNKPQLIKHQAKREGEKKNTKNIYNLIKKNTCY